MFFGFCLWGFFGVCSVVLVVVFLFVFWFFFGVLCLVFFFLAFFLKNVIRCFGLQAVEDIMILFLLNCSQQ